MKLSRLRPYDEPGPEDIWEVLLGNSTCCPLSTIDGVSTVGSLIEECSTEAAGARPSAENV